MRAPALRAQALSLSEGTLESSCRRSDRLDCHFIEISARNNDPHVPIRLCSYFAACRRLAVEPDAAGRSNFPREALLTTGRCAEAGGTGKPGAALAHRRRTGRVERPGSHVEGFQVAKDGSAVVATRIGACRRAHDRW